MIRSVPIYDYRCDACGHAFSAVRSYSEGPVEKCPNCGKRPRRLITAPAVVFKGSGWYKTDSRGAAPAEGESSKPAEKTDAKSDTKTSDRGPVKSTSDAPAKSSGDAPAKPSADAAAKSASPKSETKS
jgi:putative FmdB family regulatory protein